MRRLIGLSLLGLGLIAAVPLIAQDQQQMSNEQEKDWLVKFVQDRISTPDRQISISNIEGVLSQDASINEITISDAQGVWLRINKAAINWNQGALLGGRLEIRTLQAESIDYLRNAIPAEQPPGLPAPEAGGLDIPDLPVAVILQKLSVPKVTFGEQVFGLASEVSVEGGFELDGGNLDADLDIVRRDGPGGRLQTILKYLKQDQNIDLDVTLSEPENGIVANLLNLEGRPEVALALKGAGPVSNLDTELTLDAAGKRALTGTARIKQQPEGFDIAADLYGPVADLMAEAYRPFFGGETALTARALVKAGGGLSISALNLSGGQLALSATAETTPDNFLSALQLDATIADPAGDVVTLPVAGNATRVDTARVRIDYGSAGSQDWTGSVAVNGFQTGEFAADTLNLTAGGVAANLDQPDLRRVTFNGDGSLSGITAAEDVKAALGDVLSFGLAGLWNAGEPVQLAQLRLVGKALTLSASGKIDNSVFDGTIGLDTASLAPFSGLAGRDLSGALALTATGTISPLIAGFNLTLDGTADNLGINDEIADPLLAGRVQLSGRVARTEQGLEAERFRLGNQQVQIGADGTFATGAADFGFTVDLADLALISPDTQGALNVIGTAKGQEGDIALTLDARVPTGQLAERSLRDAAFGFAGHLQDGNLDGKLGGTAFLEGLRVDLTSGLSLTPEKKRLSALRFEAGGTLLTGDLAQNADGLLDGELVLDSSNITTAAALALIEATGTLKADIKLAAVAGKQTATVAGNARNLKAMGTSIGAADINATIADLFGVPAIDGAITGSAISAAGVDIATLDARANQTGDATTFDANATLVNSTRLTVAGGLNPLDDGYRLALDSLALTQGQLSAKLARPTALTIAGDTVALDAVQLDVGGGRITASGTAGQVLDIDLTISALPLSIANAIQPDLRLNGAINGNARISGSASAPQASFNLSGEGIGAAAIDSFGIAPLRFSANGSFVDNKVTLADLRASGAQGLSVSGSGTIPLAGDGLALAATGSIPLTLGNRFVAERGGQLSGTLSLDARVSGSLSAPRFSGELATSNGQYIDPELSLRLNAITGSASLTGDAITINRLSAQLATGGTVSASGTIGLTGNLPANIALALDSARYADGNMLVATLSGRLGLTGALTQSPLLSGDVLIEQADLTIPDNLGGGANLVDVRHRATPPAVQATLNRAKAGEPTRKKEQGRPSILQLNVNVNAPNKIFIRGRGLDAEVGGSVRLTGPVTDIQPVGGFSLNRGRLSILGQRITFESGMVTLAGDLDPFVNFVARTEGSDITVFVTVTGRISEVEVKFSSNPALPEDEVLARLLFKRSMGELTPLQLAKLAGAAAELAGGSNSSLVDSLREATGLADLDVVTDDEGNLAVQAGTYLQDNIYLSVQAGADGQSRVSINLDVTDDVKAKASVDAAGNSTVGIFFEQDY